MSAAARATARQTSDGAQGRCTRGDVGTFELSESRQTIDALDLVIARIEDCLKLNQQNLNRV